MDDLGLAILEKELEADATILRAAADTARLRLRERQGGFAEAAAYELARFYTVLEKAFERICIAFENHFDKRSDYHDRLLQRLAIALPGIRPGFVPPGELVRLSDLKGFRRVVRHAYDLSLRPARLDELCADASRVAQSFPIWTTSFAASVRREQDW